MADFLATEVRATGEEGFRGVLEDEVEGSDEVAAAPVAAGGVHFSAFSVGADALGAWLPAGVEVLACRLCLASASRFNSRVSKAGQVFSSKSRNTSPSSAVVDSKRSRERSVC